MASRIGLALIAAFLFFSTPALTPGWAQDLPVSQQLPPRAAPTRAIQVEQLPILDTTPQFDAAKATDTWLSRMEAPARQKSDSYFEGGYGLRLVELGYGLVIAALLLWLQISARIRDWAEERTHSRTYQVMLYAIVYIASVAVFSLPLSVYEGFFREHAYGFSNQSLLQWGGDFATGFAVILAAGVLVLPIIYGAMRAARANWWIWASGLSIIFLIIALVISPLAIEPLFNHYSPLPEGPLKAEILSLARANGVPASTVWQVDESRQTTRISANVSGFLGTSRIALGDNLLKQASPGEVLAVVGHEMGHYVMDHTTKLVLLFGLIIITGFGFTAWCFHFATDMFGGNWQVRRPDDIAGLPLLMAIFSIFLFFAAPLTNTILRRTEHEADIFGVNAARKPDAFASVVLKLSATRKLDPGAWEETIFYDHPSGRSRIETMMRWKKEHVRDLDIRDSVANNPR